jgi:glycogen(starch) synthase
MKSQRCSIAFTDVKGALFARSTMLPKPKRILMTTDTVGGVWTYAVELADALRQHGITVALATMGATLTRDQRRQVRRLSNVEIFESTFKLEWMPDPWEDIERASAWLLEIARGVRPDLVHLNNFVHGNLPWKAPTLTVGHSCVLSWWRAVKRCRISPEWKRYATQVRKGLQASDMVVAPSRAMLAELEVHYGAFERARVICNARNPDLFSCRTKESFIFSAGRIWDEAKNIKHLVDVAPEISWPIYIAGEDRSPGTENRAPCDNVKMLGRLPEDVLADWLGRAGIYAAPALYEPFGLSILEAAMAGCALILSDIPSLREIWSGAALFVPANDSAALKSSLAKLIDDAAKRHDLAACAQCRAIQFNPHQMVAGYLSAYGEILGNQHSNFETGRVCADTDVLSHAAV